MVSACCRTDLYREYFFGGVKVGSSTVDIVIAKAETTYEYWVVVRCGREIKVTPCQRMV